jgi:hypothetical protein
MSHRSVGSGIVLAPALVLAFALFALGIGSRSASAQPGATPTPTAVTRNPATVVGPSTVSTDSLPLGSSNPTTAQIASVAERVAQVAADATLPADAKTQQVAALADEFNRLVVQWEAEKARPPASPTPGVASPPPTAPAAAIPPPTAPAAAIPPPMSPAAAVAPQATPSGAIPPPTSPGGPIPLDDPSPATAGTADQLRAQIADIADQMGQVSNDTSLPLDQKVARLTTLAAQFDQLVLQLNQQGR